MEIMIALASEYVDKLPKGAKITNYEIYHPRGNKLLGRGEASTLKQIFKKMEFVVPLGMTVDVVVIADLDGAARKVKDSYVMKSTGPVKV